MSKVSIIALGASWGGLHALSIILAALPKDMPPIVIAQHRSAQPRTDNLAQLLAAKSVLSVCEVVDKYPLEDGCVYLAPPDYHLLVEEGHCGISVEEPVRFSRPSIDVLFESAADSYGKGSCGVILTGSNSDGADGLKAIFARGGACLVQDPAQAESPKMPLAALAAVPSAQVLALPNIAPYLVALCAGGVR